MLMLTLMLLVSTKTLVVLWHQRIQISGKNPNQKRPDQILRSEPHITRNRSRWFLYWRSNHQPYYVSNNTIHYTRRKSASCRGNRKSNLVQAFATRNENQPESTRGITKLLPISTPPPQEERNGTERRILKELQLTKTETKKGKAHYINLPVFFVTPLADAVLEW